METNKGGRCDVYKTAERIAQGRGFPRGAQKSWGQPAGCGKVGDGPLHAGPATLAALASFFKVSVDYLLGCGAAPMPGSVLPYLAAEECQIPVIGTVRAGFGALAFEEDYGTEPASVKDPDSYFYLLVRGDSMEPRIREGDLALVAPPADAGKR